MPNRIDLCSLQAGPGSNRRYRLKEDSYIEVNDEDIIEVLSLDEPSLPEIPVVRVAGVYSDQPGPHLEIDPQTELDLGVAYREMGQLSSAIQQFKKVIHLESKRVYCHMMIGLCNIDLGLIEEAIRELKNGLYLEQVTEREAAALQYELGKAFERKGDPEEALYYYRRVARWDPQFRNVQLRVSRLAPRPRRRQLAEPPSSERLIGLVLQPAGS